jgi:hypothetical protein
MIVIGESVVWIERMSLPNDFNVAYNRDAYAVFEVHVMRPSQKWGAP